MSNRTRILVVEDNPADVDLLREILPETGPPGFDIQCVSRLSEALSRLKEGGSDVVLLDLGLPDSQGMETFHILRTAAPHIPVVILTGNADRETAIAAMREGAQDYLVKGRIDGELLIRSVQYAIEREKSADALRKSEEKFRSFFEISADLVCISDIAGSFREINKSWPKVLGYSEEEILGRPFMDFVHPDDKTRTELIIEEKLRQGETIFSFENRYVRKDGGVVWLEWTSQPSAAGDCTFAIARNITQRHQAEEKIREQYAILHGIQESLNSPIFSVDSEYRYVSFNRTHATVMEALYGVQIELGHNLLDYQTRRDDRDKTKANIDRSLGGEQFIDAAYSGEDELSRRYFEVSHTPIRDEAGAIIGVVIMAFDATSRKQAEDALRRSDTQLQAILESAADGILAVDGKGKVLKANRRFAELWRIPPSLAESGDDQILLDYVLEQLTDPDAFLNKVKMLYGSDAADADTLSFKDGRFFERVSFPMILEGNVIGRVWSFRDITARMRAEEQVRTLNADLEQRVRTRTAEWEAANKELEAFTYSVSHDLRAPLRAVDGFTRILFEEHEAHLPPEAQRYLNLIHANTLQMGRLVDDLLKFSRLNRQTMVKGAVDPSALAREAWDQQGGDRDGRRVTITIADMPSCQGDPALLKQVFINLLSNALKFTRKRDPAIIEVGCRHTAGVNVCFVRDNGVGFDMRYADKLFGVFQRLHKSEDYEGTGVGLAIVQRIVHRHGGRVWAEAELDLGATFYFSLEGNPL